MSTTLWLLLFSAVTHFRCVKAARVIGGNRTVTQGQSVSLPCRLIESTEDLTQISWQKKTRGKPVKDNFFIISPEEGPHYVNGQDDRITFIGDIKENNGSLQLSDAGLLDEGVYTCIFTLFPSGAHKTEIPLTVLVPPASSLKAEGHVLGDQEVTLATCEAAGAKPPAVVRWDTGSLGDSVRSETSQTQHDNDTTTTISRLVGVPTRKLHHHTVRCVVTQVALATEEILPLTIEVYFSPTTMNLTETSKNVFECVSDASPEANYTWSRVTQQGSQSSVITEGKTLHFLSLNADLSGLYVCEASNPYGTKFTHLFVSIPSGSCTACWTIFIIFLLIAAGAALVVLYWKKYGKWPWIRGETRDVRQPVDTEDTPAAEEEERDM